jgi:hypothetical protein
MMIPGASSFIATGRLKSVDGLRSIAAIERRLCSNSGHCTIVSSGNRLARARLCVSPSIDQRQRSAEVAWRWTNPFPRAVSPPSAGE